MSYEWIKELSKEHNMKIPDLLVLARGNDPFFAGTDTDIKKAQWFKQIWDEFGYSSGTHIRRIHYQLISQHHPTDWNGKPYENTDECWKMISAAAKVARYLGLVNPDQFVDRRNPEPHIYEGKYEYEPEQPTISFSEEREPVLPSVFTSLYAYGGSMPKPEVSGYDYSRQDQPYITEVWIEKSTMNDVLVPLSYEFGFNLVTSIGFQSITAAVAAINRARIAKKPLRIFYISDFDPAGCGMPVAVARQIEFWLSKYWPDGEAKLQTLALTEEQCLEYELPRTPIKESDKRKAHFEDTYGTGATELDALEALHPGVLADIVRQAIRPYKDNELPDKYNNAYDESVEMINDHWNDITQESEDAIRKIKREANKIAEEYQDQLTEIAEKIDTAMEPLKEEADSVWQAIQEKIDEELPTLEELLMDRPEPELDPIDEDGFLFDSSRDYGKQLSKYKVFQNK